MTTLPKTTEIWRCPLCQSPLTSHDNTLRCADNHSFDRAREGYVNLLVAQHKKSKQPGDNKQMVASRRAFLEAGFYQPLSQAINELCQSTLGAQELPANLLDCGCGEGYYTRQLQLANPGQFFVAGLDISKFAVRAAAKAAGADSTFSVASSYRLPVDDGAVDVILRVFAPGDEQEAARVLREGGHMLLVTPGPQHLHELKTLIYPEARQHSAPQTPAGFESVAQHDVQFTLSLPSQERISQLLLMTPFYWQIPEAARQRASELEQLDTQADFNLQLLRKL